MRDLHAHWLAGDLDVLMAPVELVSLAGPVHQRDERLGHIAGVNGTLQVYPDLFELDARLGFLVSAFKHHIEAELNTQFDKLLAPAKAKPAKKKAG